MAAVEWRRAALQGRTLERGFGECSVETLFIQMTGRERSSRRVRMARQGLGK